MAVTVNEGAAEGCICGVWVGRVFGFRGFRVMPWWSETYFGEQDDDTDLYRAGIDCSNPVSTNYHPELSEL